MPVHLALRTLFSEVAGPSGSWCALRASAEAQGAGVPGVTRGDLCGAARGSAHRVGGVPSPDVRPSPRGDGPQGPVHPSWYTFVSV